MLVCLPPFLLQMYCVADASLVYDLAAAMLLQFLVHACLFTPPCLCLPSAVQQKHKHANVRSALLAYLRCLAQRCVYAVGSCALLAWPANNCRRRNFQVCCFVPAAFPVAEPAAGVMDRQQPHGMVRSRRCRPRGGSAPPAPARLSREPYIEDIAAQQLAATFSVVWQCEVDFRWQCWADYCGEHARILEAAWDFMATQVELSPSASRGEDTLWLVNLSSMLQQNLHTGTLRRVRRNLVTHY